MVIYSSIQSCTYIHNYWTEVINLKKKNHQLVAKQAAVTRSKLKAKKMSSRLAKRLTSNISVTVGSIATESIPLLGIATIIGVNIMDVNDACNTMGGMNDLLTVLRESPDESKANEVCAYRDQIPSVAEIKAKVHSWF